MSIMQFNSYVQSRGEGRTHMTLSSRSASVPWLHRASKAGAPAIDSTPRSKAKAGELAVCRSGTRPFEASAAPSFRKLCTADSHQLVHQVQVSSVDIPRSRSAPHGYQAKAGPARCARPPSPVWSPPLPVLVHVEEQLGGVHRGGGAGVQEQLLVLGQVLGRVLLGQPRAVQELTLQQRQVRLQEREGVKAAGLISRTSVLGDREIIISISIIEVKGKRYNHPKHKEDYAENIYPTIKVPCSPCCDQSLWAEGRDQEVGRSARSPVPSPALPPPTWFPVRHAAIGACGPVGRDREVVPSGNNVGISHCPSYSGPLGSVGRRKGGSGPEQRLCWQPGLVTQCTNSCTLKGTVGCEAVVGTGEDLGPSSAPPPGPSRRGPQSPVCQLPRSCHPCSHALTAPTPFAPADEAEQLGLVPAAVRVGPAPAVATSTLPRLGLVTPLTCSTIPPQPMTPTMFRTLPPAADARHVPRTPPGGQHIPKMYQNAELSPPVLNALTVKARKGLPELFWVACTYSGDICMPGSYLCKGGRNCRIKKKNL
ncbi:hypothetical protein QTO34_007587 [Cnephaeus nilssonii]|uniref:Uncharacterized protein n=1 Tax=Cnephaeus nilssonii TaxID=3371016 RepID=A0AA40HJP6_CNENI|nr:hypothetical protein QTO34_007587 [Eptesicus nilssonii]